MVLRKHFPRALFAALVALCPGSNAETHLKEAEAMPVLKQSDVVFMYAATDEEYKAYGATFVGWGGANTPEQVRRHHDLGIRCTGSMWCLTAGAKRLHEDPKLLAAVSRDIEGNPVEVPWLFDHTHEGTKSYFGCTNHPDFRTHNREQVRQVMAGGADGLHIDDHAGVASSAWYFGGGLCDYCIAAFREYLRKNVPKAELEAAGVTDLDSFDYRDLIRKHATTREQYLKVKHEVPLMVHFLTFHAEAAAENVRQLGELAAQVAGHPVLLSANATPSNDLHKYVMKHLTHVICEVPQGSEHGTRKIEGAIKAYETATRIGKPVAATAGGHDWDFAKANDPRDLVRFWIAVAYAHGQRFMTPHPTRQWCFNNKTGTHWYAAPIDAFAPMYRFIRANAQWFDGFDGLEAEGVRAPENVLCTVRRSAQKHAVVVHVVNRDYDEKAKKMRPANAVTVAIPKALLPSPSVKARILSWDAEPVAGEVSAAGESVKVTIPELRLWSLIVFE